MRKLNDNIQNGNLAQEDTFKVSDVHRNYLHGNPWPAGLTRNFLVWDVWTLTVGDLGVNLRQLSLNPLQALPSPVQNESPLQPPYHPSPSSLKKKLQKRKHSIGDNSRGSHQSCHLYGCITHGYPRAEGTEGSFWEATRENSQTNTHWCWNKNYYFPKKSFSAGQWRLCGSRHWEKMITTQIPNSNPNLHPGDWHGPRCPRSWLAPKRALFFSHLVSGPSLCHGLILMSNGYHRYTEMSTTSRRYSIRED